VLAARSGRVGRAVLAGSPTWGALSLAPQGDASEGASESAQMGLSGGVVEKPAMQ